MFQHLKIDLQDLLNKGISREDAIDLVANAVENEKTKRKQTIEEAVHIAATSTVSKAFSEHRRGIYRRAAKISRDRESVTTVLKEKVAGLMGFRLPCGLALADATGKDCDSAVEFYMANAAIYHHRANFLRQVAERAGNKRVGKILNETDLQHIFESVGGL